MTQKPFKAVVHVNPRWTKGIKVGCFGSLFILLIILVLTSEVLSASALNESPKVIVKVTPTSVEIPPQGQIKVLVVARNPTAEKLQKVSLSWFSDAGVDIKAELPKSDVLLPYGSLAWTLGLTRVKGVSITKNIHLRIDYYWNGRSEIGAVPCLSLASIKVAARDLKTVEQVAKVQVKTALKSLMEHRPGIVHLLITNISNMPIRVAEIKESVPEFLKCTLPKLVDGVSIGPQMTRIFNLKVETTDTVQTGTHVLLFDVKFKWGKSDHLRTSNIVKTHEVEVGILGESELLTALGVPSFLILPGFLMVITFGMLWRLVEPRTEFPLKAKSSEFWLVAITLSLLTAIIYPVVTEWIGVTRNYLKGYGLNDVVWVWFLSVILSSVAYFMSVGGPSLYKRILSGYRQYEKQQCTPSERDTPITVLRKLHKQNRGIELERVDFIMEGENQRAYLLEQWEEGQTKFWVGPTITVKWIVGADDELQEKIREKVVEQLDKYRNAKILAGHLEKGQDSKVLQASWKHMGQLIGPHEADASGLKRVDATIFIEQE